MTSKSSPQYNDQVMTDANDQYSQRNIVDGQPDYRQQYASRSRPTSQQYIPQEQSAAARRYSPMRVTPAPSDRTPNYVSYIPNPQAPRNPQSPSRPMMYQSPSYYNTPSKQLARLCQAMSNSYPCSSRFSRASVTVTSIAYSYEPRIALLSSTIRDTTVTCNVRQGRYFPNRTNAEHTTTSRTSTTIHEMLKYSRIAATDERAATVPASESRGRFHQCQYWKSTRKSA
jgi:hypothetical protein